MFDRQKGNKPSYDEPQDNSNTPAPNPANVSTVSASRISAMIGPTINITGDISGDENLVIEGKVEGKVDLGNKEVTIGKTGRVKANVNASVIKVEGEIQGDMSGAEKVVISKTGKVQGNIVAPRVTLEDGAKFKGSIDMDPGEQSTQAPVTSINASSKAQSSKESSTANSTESSAGSSSTGVTAKNG